MQNAILEHHATCTERLARGGTVKARVCPECGARKRKRLSSGGTVECQ
jgi:hypothetical protein